MRLKPNHRASPTARIFARTLSAGVAALLPVVALMTLAFPIHADPRATIGGANFTDGDTGSVTVAQYNALLTLGAKMSA